MAADSRDAYQRDFAKALGEGRFDEAALACRTYLALAPDHAEAWFNLGYALRCQRLFAEADKAYAQAIARGVDHADEAHTNRAAILLEHLLRPEEAERELLAALEINPHSLPALLTLGQLHEDLGRADQAADIYRRAIAVSPSCGRAHARLAGLTMAKHDAAAAIAPLQQAARGLAQGSDDFAEVVIMLGQAFEKSGRHQEAFAAYTMANTAARGLVPPAMRYSPRAAEAFADRIIAAPPPVHGDALSAAPAPIFICGMLRSGSTLAERILAQHPRVTAGGEIEAIPALAAALVGYPEALAVLSEDDRKAMRASYLAETAAAHGDYDLLTDKRPDNFQHIGLIKALFPGARIINTVRDPADTTVSLYANLFGPAVPYAHSLSDIRHWQQLHDRIMAHWRGLWGDDILTLSYEALVSDPASSVAALLEHCGLDWDDACLALPHEGGSVRTLSQWQVREPIHARSAGRAVPFSRWLHLA